MMLLNLQSRAVLSLYKLEAKETELIYFQIAYEDLPHLGPDHKKTFSCQVTVGETCFEEGLGASKILAKKNAALNALKGLFDMPVELALKPGATNKEEMAVERHPVSILNEYGQKKGVKVTM